MAYGAIYMIGHGVLSPEVRELLKKTRTTKRAPKTTTRRPMMKENIKEKKKANSKLTLRKETKCGRSLLGSTVITTFR
ncbi:hypothetical protein L596_022100 [Steinernema carpocapsae]|uniref:Uncharacterized protein n=1 Tax=Steinernema carpocapsae TaxID=34508 RepID=A0A4U5MKQ2_STECR|nr:hypothetical protein L596_022100 [Steinernema carpocapsae]